MKKYIITLGVLFPILVFGQHKIHFDVKLLDSEVKYYPLDHLPIEMSLFNDSQGKLQYHPFHLGNSKYSFNEGALKIYIRNKRNNEVEKASLYGDEDFYEMRQLHKGEIIEKKGRFYPFCGKSPCFINSGEYTVLINYFPLYSKNRYSLDNDLVFQDSFELTINPYTDNESKAFEFLVDNLPGKILKTILAKKYTAPTKDIGFLFHSYPSLVSIYESFVEEFPESSFTPWIIIRLAYAYLFNPYYSKKIAGSPDFKKANYYLEILKNYKIAKENRNLRSLIHQCHYEIKRTQKRFELHKKKQNDYLMLIDTSF